MNSTLVFLYCIVGICLWLAITVRLQEKGVKQGIWLVVRNYIFLVILWPAVLMTILFYILIRLSEMEK